MLTPKMELLIKKITHMWRRWGTPQNFFLAFIDELEKQIFIKNCWGRPIKNKIILICTNVPFLKKIKKYTCRDHNQNLNDMIYSSWDIEQNRLKLIILGHFLPLLPPLTTKKIKILKKWKKAPGGIIILHMCTINDNHTMYGSWGMEQDRQNFLRFWTPAVLSFYTCTP